MFDQPGPEISAAFAGDNQYASWQGLGKKIDVIEELGASAVVVIPESQLVQNWNRMSGYFNSARMSVAGESMGGVLPDADIPVFILSRHVVEDLFEGQPFDPIARTGSYGAFSLSGVQAEARVESVSQDMSAPNVVGLVEGSDPQLKHEYVVVGAHLDHVGTREGQVYNGADDNASGSVGVLEIAEAMAMAPPKRSLIFVLFSGEEMGLLGSSFFVDNPPVPVERIKAMVNLEMIGRWSHRPKGAGQLFAILGTPGGDAMREAVHAANRQEFEYELEIPDRFMGGSDHIAFERAGIPNITFAGSPPYGTHEDYHQPGDDAEKIEIPAMRKAVAYIYEVVLELANR
jgi:Zn-dependent M28 family amino/carboxypeptidase